ncbi:DUF1345 domain-containing protein [Rhizobium sp. 18055]|jgi:uncharacterized membrane protein|uniref:DUF1345 domain-containing protein n=1 Tax=Rhizobium sp. 18055 TaxID=2681403 RepID=UPI00135B420E|nr:DUF1345 domain-containing protein [Rhizobium sp. 18055]
MAGNTRGEPSRLMKLMRKHAVFLIALLVGLLVFLLLTTREVNARNLLAGWNVSALLFIAATWWRMLRASVEKIRKRSADLDFSDSLLLFLSIVAALASVAGIGLELHQVKDAAPGVAFARALTAIATILISWVFLHTLFTLHYAHRFYGGDDDGDGVKGDGLKFPEGVAEPLYWDFLYYSFTIGVASQTADVATTSTGMRKLTLLHSVLSFLFNTTILALAINVGASLL